VSDAAERDAADAYCRLRTSGHYENFIVASRFAPARTQLDLARIYAFCRTTDDLGDESGAGATARLERWQSEVEAMFAGNAPVHPVLVALHETVIRCSVPRQPFVDLIAANLQDQRVHSYEDWPSLLAYCHWSAAPVGRMVLAVFGMGGAAAEHLSDDVCIGLQLANFAQDVSVDAAKGRSYLLQSELREGGAVAATKAHCERARSLLASGERLETMAPAPLRFQLALYRLGGLAICAAIARAGFDTRTHRPTVSAAAKVWTLMHAGARLLQGNGHVGSVETA
jgi:phytoene/squalene synthetase